MKRLRKWSNGEGKVSCKSAFLFILLAVPVLTFAGVIKEIGTFGQVYPIVEPDIVTELQQGIPKVDLEKMKADYAHYQPADLHKLPKAKADRTFSVSMMYTLDHDLTDEKGQVLYKKGYTFNPLQYSHFIGGLVVIDGSDPAQVDWFKASSYFTNNQAILLLSDGYAAELKEQLKRTVYYLTKDIQARLHFAAVPSVAIPQDKTMMVREVKIADK